MSKRRVKLPGRFSESKWFVIRYSSDKELSPPLTSSQLEDEETGETGEEKEFKVGDQVQAPWNGVMYQGKIEFESDSKDECLKYTDSKKKTKKRRARHVPAKKTAADVEDADAILKKSKKEKNEKKKKIEAAQKHTAITTAEELFKCSFLTASHATNDKH